MSTTAEQPSDVNFVFPWRDLENDRVKLVPFNSITHGPEYWAGIKDHPEIYDYLSRGPFPSLEPLLAYLDSRFQRSPEFLLLAVLDKASPPTPIPASGEPQHPLAGLVGFLHADPANLSVELGALVCLPAFQRRRITYAAVALLLQYALNLPTDGGLGLRRVQYQANANNDRSVGFAKKIGFRLEGVARWQRVLDVNRPGNGRGARKGDPRAGAVGADTAVLSMCWDDWEDGKGKAVCLPAYAMYKS